MKKLLIFTISVLAILAVAGCNKKAEQEEEPMMQMPNPFMEYSSLADAEQATGFRFDYPENIGGAVGYAYRVMNGEMLEVICLGTNETSAEVARIRKAKGSDDISGDYNVYGDVKNDNSLNNLQIRGENGLYSGAVWVEGEYTFALSLEEAVPFDQMKELVSQIH